MTASAPPLEQPPIAPREVAGIWVRHLASLLFPGNALLFLWTGPHPWYVAPLFLLPLVAAFLWDTGPRVERRQPDASTPAWPFDSLVYLLAALQLLIIFELPRMFAQQGFFSIDMLVMVLVVGGSSGFSIITAHELIHRRKPWERQLGRLLLCTVLQEHFYTEHLRGHHVRVGLPEDPATARFGEGYEAFYRRTIPAQFRSAWRLGAGRLGDPEMPLFDRRLLHSRVVHGLVLGWGIATAIAAIWGTVAFVAFLLQAFFASRLLEAVNYFEHWGLRRRQRRVLPRDSWDTHAWFTYYGLTGLSRHADHHAEASRPFQQLRVFDDVPMLPYGYVGMVDLVMAKNGEFRERAALELRRCRLGPFAEGEPGAAEGSAVPRETPSAEEPSRVARVFAPLRAAVASWPAGLRRGVAIAAILLGTTVAVQLESGDATSFAARLALHAWILAALVATIGARRALGNAGWSDGPAWLLATAVLIALGSLAEGLGLAA